MLLSWLQFHFLCFNLAVLIQRATCMDVDVVMVVDVIMVMVVIVV